MRWLRIARSVGLVVQTYPLVSQFWTYSSPDFLKQPLYSRDYPPARP
jgi:branched-chain amino acid transport system substrate-binding protein